MKELSAHRVERTALGLVGVATLASLLVGDRAVVLGIGVGGGMAAVNFMALRRILGSIFRSAGSNPQKQAVMAVLLMLKFGVLAASLYLVLRYVPLSALAFLVGVSLVVLAIFAEGLVSMLRGPAAQSE